MNCPECGKKHSLYPKACVIAAERDLTSLIIRKEDKNTPVYQKARKRKDDMAAYIWPKWGDDSDG